MIGKQPNIPGDIELELEELVLPQNLLSEESLSPDSEADEEEELQPFKIDTCCACETGVRVCVLATSAAIRTLQQLLLQELKIICPRCSRNLLRNGRQ